MLVFDDDDELLGTALPFLRDGIDAGDTTVVSVGDRQRPLILDALGDPSGVTVLPEWAASEAFRTLQQNERLIADGNGHQVRILGVVPSPDQPVPWGGWVRYETALNHVYADLPVSMLCPYDRRTTPDSVIEDVRCTHRYLSGDDEHPVLNDRFVEPSEFLGDLARRDVDPVESESPELTIVDQPPRTSRHAVSALAASIDLDGAVVEGLSLAVGEVVTNAIRHGRPPVVVRAWAPSDRVVVSVRDHGDGPADPFVGMVPARSAPLGGLGLHVAYRTCSLVTMERSDDDFTVHLTMRR
jgi:anti-sigma regulatory factor (Ser/Thr protein kinase)